MADHSDEVRKYASFERLYRHHTVASLASRVDFDPSMLENRKSFQGTSSSISSRRRHGSVSSSSASTALVTSSTSVERRLSSQVAEDSNKIHNYRTPPRRSKPPSRRSEPSLTKPSMGATPPLSLARRSHTKASSSASISRMIASSRPSKQRIESNASANSSASTLVTENTSRVFSTVSEKSEAANKYSNLTVDVTETVVGNTGRSPPKDEHDDVLDDILDVPASSVVPRSFGETEENDAVANLAAQEAAIEKALDQAVEDCYETAASISPSSPVPINNGGKEEGNDEDADIENKPLDGGQKNEGHNNINNDSIPMMLSTSGTNPSSSHHQGNVME